MIEISNKRKNEKGNISFNVITKIKNTQNYYLQKKKKIDQKTAVKNQEFIRQNRKQTENPRKQFQGQCSTSPTYHSQSHT